MRDLKRIPNPEEVPPGSVLLWTDADDKRRLRMAMAGLTLGSAAAGAGVGYAVGRARRKKNPSKKRKGNPTPLQWTGLTLGGAAAIGLTYVALRRLSAPSAQPPHEVDHDPLPGGRPTGGPGDPLPPQTSGDECSPLDPSTWGYGNLCVYNESESRWVRYSVPPEGPQGAQYVYKCTAEFVDDHPPLIGERHAALSDNGAYQLETALAMDKQSVSAPLDLGIHPLDVISRHDHRIDLTATELDALRAGQTIDVMSAGAGKGPDSWGEPRAHTHHVRIRCTRVRV